MKKKFKALRGSKNASKSSKPKVAAPFAKGPKHMMGMPEVGSQPTGADAEMKKLMQNRGIPRRKAS